MTDEIKEGPLAPGDIKRLVQEVADTLEAQLDTLREGSEYASIRPSDAKMFALISEKSRTISQLARTLRISRQAAHASIGRLTQFKIVELHPAPGSRRDKVAVITGNGQSVQTLTANQAQQIEAYLEEKIGKDRIDTLRSILTDILSQNAH